MNAETTESIYEFPEGLLARLAETNQFCQDVAKLELDVEASSREVASVTAKADALGVQIEALGVKIDDPETMTESRMQGIARGIAQIEARRVMVEQMASVGFAPEGAIPVNKIGGRI